MPLDEREYMNRLKDRFGMPDWIKEKHTSELRSRFAQATPRPRPKASTDIEGSGRRSSASGTNSSGAVVWLAVLPSLLALAYVLFDTVFK